jgi:uncharacterized membrane protein YbhN (UPF0104 family)
MISDYNFLLIPLFILLAFLGLLFLFLNANIASKISPYLGFLEKYVLLSKIKKLYNSIIAYKNQKILLSMILILCLIAQSMRIFIAYLFCLSLNVSVSIIYFFMFIPIIYLLMLLPVSINGIGVQESAYVFFFSKIGMDTATILAIPILGYVAFVINSVPGGVIYLLEGTSPKKGDLPKETVAKRI